MTRSQMLYWIVLGTRYVQKYAFYLILVGGLLNLLTSFGIYRYQFEGLIIRQALFFGLLLLIAYILTEKQKVNSE